jgi:hypothetical protein
MWTSKPVLNLFGQHTLLTTIWETSLIFLSFFLQSYPCAPSKPTQYGDDAAHITFIGYSGKRLQEEEGKRGLKFLLRKMASEGAWSRQSISRNARIMTHVTTWRSGLFPQHFTTIVLLAALNRPDPLLLLSKEVLRLPNSIFFTYTKPASCLGIHWELYMNSRAINKTTTAFSTWQWQVVPYWLVTPWKRIVLEEQTGTQMVNKLLTLYCVRRFITMFTRVHH